jgi:hypothetical protein
LTRTLYAASAGSTPTDMPLASTCDRFGTMNTMRFDSTPPPPPPPPAAASPPPPPAAAAASPAPAALAPPPLRSRRLSVFARCIAAAELCCLVHLVNQSEKTAHMAFRTSGTISRRERAPSGATNIGQVKAAVAAAELAAAPPPPPRVVLSPRPPPPRAAAESKVPQADSPRKVRRAVRTDATSYGLQITVHRDYGFDVAVPKLYHGARAAAAA